MSQDILIFSTQEGQKRNNSTLSYADCCMRLTDWSYTFEDMSNDDLDSLYVVAFKRWAWHLTREGYIMALNKWRQENSLS